MTTTFSETYRDEIAFLASYLATTSDEELDHITDLGYAQNQIDRMQRTMALPYDLRDPETMLAVWTYCSGREKARRRNPLRRMFRKAA